MGMQARCSCRCYNTRGKVPSRTGATSYGYSDRCGADRGGAPTGAAGAELASAGTTAARGGQEGERGGGGGRQPLGAMVEPPDAAGLGSRVGRQREELAKQSEEEPSATGAVVP